MKKVIFYSPDNGNFWELKTKDIINMIKESKQFYNSYKFYKHYELKIMN